MTGKWTVFYFGACNSVADVKRTWRELMKKYHPDKAAMNGLTATQAESVSKDINAQYQALLANFDWEIPAHREYERTRQRKAQSEQRAADGAAYAKEKDTTHKDFQEDQEGPAKGHWTGYSSGDQFGRKAKTQAQTEASRNGKDAKDDPEAAARIEAALKVARSIPGQTTEQIGLWLWLEFKAKPDEATREKLKNNGFKWSAQRQKWYYPGVKSSGRRKGRGATDDELRGKYGSTRY